MNRAIVISLLLLTLGISMSVFVKKITATNTKQHHDSAKISINITNDSVDQKPIRIYRGVGEKNAGAGILVNPGKNVSISINSEETISVYTPKKNATYRISLNKIAQHEAPRTINTSLQELEKTAQQHQNTDNDHTEKYGENNYLYVEEEIVPPFGTYGTLPY